MRKMKALPRRSILKLIAVSPLALRSGTLSILIGAARQAFARTPVSAHEFQDISAQLLGVVTSDLDISLSNQYYKVFSSTSKGRDQLTGLRATLASLNKNIESIKEIPAPFDETSRKIVRAWYSGVIADKNGQRRMTYDGSLMFKLFSKERNPPVQCSGIFGSWSQKPNV